MLHRGILALALAAVLSVPAQAEYKFRPLSSGNGIGTVNGIVKGDGAGNPSQAVAGTDYVVPSALSAYLTTTTAASTYQAQSTNLTNLIGVTTGCTARISATAWLGRTITGTANEIAVANGNCLAGNPTLSLPSALTFTGKTVTDGTFNTGAFNGTLGATTPSTVAATNVAVSTAPGTQVNVASFFTPGMSNGQKNYIQLGNAPTNNNGFYFNYNHDATAANRYLSIQPNELGFNDQLVLAANGNVGIGLLPTARLHVTDQMLNNANGGIACYDSTAFAQGVGCRLALGGKYNSGGGYSTFGAIAGIKESSSDGDTGGTIAFYPRASGSSVWGAPPMSLNSLGQLMIGTTVSGGSGPHLIVSDTGAATAYNSSKITRTETINTDTQGGQNAALQVSSTGTNTSNPGGGIIAQPVAITALATQNGSGDAVSYYSIATLNNTHPSQIYAAFPFFGACYANTSKSGCVNFGGGVINASGVSRSWVATGPWYFVGIDLPYSGNGSANDGEAAALIRTATGRWDCGYCIQDGAVRTYAYYYQDFKVFASGGVNLGVPTGGDKGAGTMNVAGDIYQNNAPYVNPDYVFEKYFTGKIEKFADKHGAASYQAHSIEDTEAIAQRTLRLPGMDDAPKGMFERSDFVLEKVEEAYLHIFKLNDENKRMQACLSSWKCRIFGIGG